MVVFFTTNNENTYPKGRALMQVYGVVLQTSTYTLPHPWTVAYTFCILCFCRETTELPTDSVSMTTETPSRITVYILATWVP